MKRKKHVHAVIEQQDEQPGTSSTSAVDVAARAEVTTYQKKDEGDGGEPYALTIVADDPYGQPYRALSQHRSWAGTREQFEAQFKLSEVKSG